MTRFVNADRRTSYLLPPSVEEWLPDGHLARFIVEVVEGLELSALVKAYGGRGSEAHHPSVLLGLLVYGYATGTFSSRKIERATFDSVAFRYIAANTHPDHDTIAAFRRRFLAELEGLFVQVLLLAREMKLLKLGNIALDGVKIKANASRHKALSFKHLNKIEAQLLREVQALLAAAEAADSTPLPDGLDVPAEIARREERLKQMAEAKAKIEKRAKARHQAEQQTYAEKAARREALRQAGKKPRGKEPKPPSEGPRDGDQINLTDEQSRIMPAPGGRFEQAYNAQAAVDTDSLLIVTTSVTQDTNDKRQIEPALNRIAALPKALGRVDTLLADTGYFSQANVRASAAQGITPLIPPSRDSHHLPLWERFAPDAPEPGGGDPLSRMLWRLKTSAGRAAYAKRKCTVEPVFGIVKNVLGFRQFLLRGLEKVTGEWQLVALAWNLKRMHRLRTA
jgi:transposase